jgi:hypothetical protein
VEAQQVVQHRGKTAVAQFGVEGIEVGQVAFAVGSDFIDCEASFVA